MWTRHSGHCDHSGDRFECIGWTLTPFMVKLLNGLKRPAVCFGCSFNLGFLWFFYLFLAIWLLLLLFKITMTT
jgi:hypothetical protein